MAITALNSAATGLRSLSTRIDVVANNLANAETTAFKRSRVNFEDLFYLQLKQPGTSNAAGEPSPAGIFVGLGTKISNTQLDLEQGSLEDTRRNLDVGIQGDGFFKVKVLDSVGDGFAYTRNGNFFLNNKGELVLGVGDGYKLEPSITLPPDATDITIGETGVVEFKQPGSTAAKQAGQLELSQFVNPEGLRLLGSGIYVETEESGPPIESKPGEDAAGVTLQGFLEASNVNVERERLRIKYLTNWRSAVLEAAEASVRAPRPPGAL
jgi:flagellar basal-body rod protein FlgG